MIKWLKSNAGVLGWISLIVMVGGFLLKSGVFIDTVQKGILSEEQKNKLIDHEASSPNEVDNLRRSIQMDSIDIIKAKGVEHAIQSRSMRDTAVKKALDLGQRNADQIYQMRQRQDTIIKLLKK